MSRSFSTTVRAMLDIFWKNTQAIPEGDEHDSEADPDLRVSGQIFNKEGMRVTSGHWYKDGRVVYSRSSFNK
ncbi:hypothetical protein BO70DRAFT_287934 [Aspergillus heteromorphus CBS 117.55]|uniref:Uncharacterized protein n=1 Tax=Aspergillus heteromorphus CBS 117.55 TaxID=1448321 RepID=A0A317WNF6_9EURO|nr:uncharacterized protein BO70DRAFT_287934 [Aspergillus heteromorphus CBS 117.55]PWY86792.1 hypothetical protein BO70DRAFT_287934 [Aspergillus heteromorphus CBS 117.55]